MKKIINGWNWKRSSFILALILLFVASVIGVLSGGESTATADSDACNKYFVGMALKRARDMNDEGVVMSYYVVNAISKERGLLTIKHEDEHILKGTYPYVRSSYGTVPCNNLVVLHGSTKYSLVPNVPK
jgi:hypothetical protein